MHSSGNQFKLLQNSTSQFRTVNQRALNIAKNVFEIFN